MSSYRSYDVLILVMDEVLMLTMMMLETLLIMMMMMMMMLNRARMYDVKMDGMLALMLETL
jgi:hypothetical protein